MSLLRNCSTLPCPFLFRSVQRRPRHSSSSCCIWHAKDGIDAPDVLAVETDVLQHTLAGSVTKMGIGLHSGKMTTLTLLPTEAGEGRYFVHKHRWDAHEKIPATAAHVYDTRLSTCLSKGSSKVRTVEHLLSALVGLGVDNCRIELDGGCEVPLLDGSALCWVKSIEEVGICIAKDGEGNTMKKEVLKITRPIFVYDDDSFVAAFPSSSQKLTCGIDFPNHEAIGKQWYSWCADKSSYKVDIAPARTFGLYEQIQQLKEAGLIKGGSLDNALVCSVDRGWLNPPLHFADEPCRHKLLDLLGDLSLCSINAISGIPFAHVIAYKASHSLHVRFSKELLQAYIRKQ